MPRRGFFQTTVAHLAVQKRSTTVPNCSACRLYRSCHSPKMPVTGKGRRGVLVVAEAPGEKEDARNTQLIGPAGQVLRGVLRSIDIDLDRDCWKTNALICRPPKNATPTDDQIAFCRPNVLNTIRELQPTCIILLGGSAIRSVIGHLWKESVGEATRWVGWQIPSRDPNCWVCPTYHPSFIMRKEKDKALAFHFRKHLRAAFETAATGVPWDAIPNYEDAVIRITDDDEVTRAIKRFIKEGRPTAFDYETNMLKPDGANARIFCCSLANGKRTIAYPWTPVARKWTGRFLDSDVPKIGAKSKFEDRWSRIEFGRPVNAWWHDVVTTAHCLDHRRGTPNVKFQGFVQFGQPIYNQLEPYLKSKGPRLPNRIDQFDLMDLLLYCGVDSHLEYLLARKQRKECK